MDTDPSKQMPVYRSIELSSTESILYLPCRWRTLVVFKQMGKCSGAEIGDSGTIVGRALDGKY